MFAVYPFLLFKEVSLISSSSLWEGIKDFTYILPLPLGGGGVGGGGEK